MSIETRTIGLKQAINEIALACTPDSLKRFVFIVGAGISNPPIPLASEITAQCREKAREDDPEVGEPAAGKRGSDYSYWFHQAFPHPQQRREYLGSLIKNQPLSPASLRLAHVLMTRQVADTVVTPNFDDFISRALVLFGEANLSICDHPRITDRIEPEEDDIKIVQVHGSYHIYDLANIQDELTDRAAMSSETTLTMSSLLDRLFASRGALIIGYGGWDGDAIMEALKRRLVSQGLPYNIYFFCYRRSNRDGLPDWIKNHPNVRFVVPPEEKTKPSEPGVRGRAGRLELDPFDPAARLIAEPLTGDRDGEPTLHAKDILDALIRRLKLAPPALVTDPLGFFERQLTEASLPKSEQDPYSFLNIAGQIGTAKKLLAEQESRRQQALTRLDSVRDALRRSQYAEAIQIASDIDVFDMGPEQAAELLQALILASNGVTGDNESISAVERIEAVFSAGIIPPSRSDEFAASVAWSMGKKAQVMFDLGRDTEALQVLNNLIDRFAHYSDLGTHEEVDRALFNKGVTLGRLGRSEEELATYDEVLRRVADIPEPAFRSREARTLLNKGVTLGQLGRSEEELATYDDLLRRFDDSTELALREQMVRALVNKGIALTRLERHEEGLKEYDEVLRRFGDAQEPKLREGVVRALFNKGVTLGQLGRSAEELATYDDLLRRFGDASDQSLSEGVARALFYKGITLGQLGRGEEELATYDDLLRRFGDSTELALREQVAKALFNKGFRLGQLGRGEEELATYDDLLRRFGDSTELALREQVAKALFNKGFRLGQLGRSEEELATYDDLLRRFGDSTELALREQVAKAVFRKGSLLRKVGRREQAMTCLTEGIQRFGGSTDSAINEAVRRAKELLEELEHPETHK